LRAPSRERLRRRPDINVTPLVDVVLVLLIIFMVVTPQLESGEHVEVPAVENPDPAVEGALSPVVVSVNTRGGIWLEKQKVASGELRERLRDVRDEDPERPVLLKGDRSARYADVRAVLDLVQELGFPGAALEVSVRPAADEEAGQGG
jgi:biopolymer transport protein ExbD